MLRLLEHLTHLAGYTTLCLTHRHDIFPLCGYGLLLLGAMLHLMAMWRSVKH